MDLRLKEDSGDLRAAVLSRVTGEEMLMIHSYACRIDGRAQPVK